MKNSSEITKCKGIRWTSLSHCQLCTGGQWLFVPETRRAALPPSSTGTHVCGGVLQKVHLPAAGTEET